MSDYGSVHIFEDGSIFIQGVESGHLYSTRRGALINTARVHSREKTPLLTISHYDLIEALIKMAEERGLSID